MGAPQAEYSWLVQHHEEAEKHAGRWIAVLGGRIVAAGRTFAEAQRKAQRRYPDGRPLVTYVPRKDERLLIL